MVGERLILLNKLSPDCGACCGLCCVAPAFDTDQGFGLDKPAHTPCPNLRPDFRCSIHDQLVERGFPGCVAFDCYGAGQRVTREMFPGASWKDSPETANDMFRAFTRLCVLHELMALLTFAQQHVAEEDIRAALAAKLHEIEALCRAEIKNPGKVDITVIKHQTMELLRSLESTSSISALISQTMIDS